MADQRLEVGARGGVPDLGGAVGGRRRDPPAVGGDADLGDGARVALEEVVRVVVGEGGGVGGAVVVVVVVVVGGGLRVGGRG